MRSILENKYKTELTKEKNKEKLQSAQSTSAGGFHLRLCRGVAKLITDSRQLRKMWVSVENLRLLIEWRIFRSRFSVENG